jgi:hypothetical protein
MTSFIWKDVSPVERAAARDYAAKLAQIARLELAVKVLRGALQEIKTHHTLQNMARGRPLHQSHTLNAAILGLKRADSYLGGQ